MIPNTKILLAGQPHSVKFNLICFSKAFHLISWCENFVEKAQFPHAIPPKLCGNCAFPQNFHTRKLGEIVAFSAVSYSELSDHYLESAIVQ